MRVLIAGLGAIGQRHARNLRALHGDRIELLAYRTRRLPFVVTETLQRDDSCTVEESLGLRVFHDLDAALDCRPTAVFVCTPSSQHVAIAQRAAEAGCHLYVEKPLSHTLDGLDALQQTVRAKRLVGLVGCQWRFHPCVRWLRDLIDTHALGRLVRVEIEYAEYLPEWHPYEDYRTSYAARADMGGGVVLTQIHDYDLAWWLCGAPQRVLATGGHLSPLEIDVEDTVDAVLEGGPVPVRIRQCFAARPPRRTVTVVGERHTATADLLTAQAWTDADRIAPLRLNGYQRNQMFIDIVAHFGECLAGRAAPAVPIDAGVAVLRVALAVKDAIRSGAAVAA